LESRNTCSAPFLLMTLFSSTTFSQRAFSPSKPRVMALKDARVRLRAERPAGQPQSLPEQEFGPTLGLRLHAAFERERQQRFFFCSSISLQLPALPLAGCLLPIMAARWASGINEVTKRISSYGDDGDPSSSRLLKGKKR
jgi:hypothetical protein